MGGVLVVYATKHGSTREVAEVIAAVLRDDAVTVDVRPARAVRGSLAGWDLVVLGAPLYSGRWHRDAHRFLKRHREELRRVPVAVFGLGPREGTDQAWQTSRSQLDRALSKHGWLSPTACALFGGADALDRATSHRRDLRDWAAIQAWADQIAQQARTPRKPADAPEP
ncbi:MAG TPA: flavodoxin domain-containing protein [Actinomycetes bacterium]